jgi:hypothetical protein
MKRTTHCTEAGGRCAETIHLRLLLYCAEICRTAADFLLTNWLLHARVCAPTFTTRARATARKSEERTFASDFPLLRRKLSPNGNR